MIVLVLIGILVLNFFEVCILSAIYCGKEKSENAKKIDKC